MNRSPDILFLAEYLQNVLYFATVRQGKCLKSTADTHYFCIDNELVYENYYSDFGPLNLGCVYKYCVLLNDKVKQYLNKQVIVHYTSIDPKKKANAAFLLGCYGVLYLSLTPKDALKPLLIHGQSYRPFQDATQGDSSFTISLIECLQAIKKARELKLFNFQDFNFEEYDRLDKIHGGDLNWIVPDKFLAFIGPEDYGVSLYHPPEMYIDYFLENNVKIVIRLNKRLYDSNVFINAGIVHYDLFFPDGSCPPRHILQKFLQIAEESDSAIAVHCKAGLGRTGSLIGCYLIKHYRMTSHEAIGWMRICRPGSVIGHQQSWLEQLEAWLIKQGNIYRKRIFNDTERLPKHNYGVYSIVEKSRGQRPLAFHKSPSPPAPGKRVIRTEISPVRPQSSKMTNKTSRVTADRDAMEEEKEIFLTSCDLTVKPTVEMTKIKGCIIRNNTIFEENSQQNERESFIKNLFCCKSCLRTFKDCVWTIAVRLTRVAPNMCNSNKICRLVNTAAAYKAEKEQHDWCMKMARMSAQKVLQKGDQHDASSTSSRRGSGAGEPRPARSLSRGSTVKQQSTRSSVKTNDNRNHNLSAGFHPTTFRSSNGPMIKNVQDAKIFLINSSLRNDERERGKHLSNSIMVTPQNSVRTPNHYTTPVAGHNTPSSYSTVSRVFNTVPQRRRLGRSPSPSPLRKSNEHTRATNTPTMQADKCPLKEASALREVLSRLKLSSPRDGSIGVASLGARRDAPAPKQAPSVRSDERPLATQGDMLNSIKFQRRLRDTMHHTEKLDKIFNNNISLPMQEKSGIRNVNSKTSTGTRTAVKPDLSKMSKPPMPSKQPPRNFFGPTRPSSPKGRRSPHVPSFY